MKQLTTIACCVVMMIFGVATAFQNFKFPNNKVAMAQPLPAPIEISRPGMPLEIGVKSNDRLSRGSSIKDSVVIRDSVRWVTKTKWKTRYKDVADRTTARDAGTHPWAVTPDSMKENPAITSTMGREEYPIDTVGVSKTPSIQLTVDGEVVYSRNDNHSGVGGQ